MAKPNNSQKSKLTPIISLKPREIYFVNFQSKTIWCRNCRTVNQASVKCTGCRSWISLDSKQRGTRPFIVVYAPPVDGNTKEESMVIVIPLTSKHQDSEPGTVVIPADDNTGLNGPDEALVYQLTVVDKTKFFQENKLGTVGDKEWNEILEKLKNLLGVNDKVVTLPSGQKFHVAQIAEIIQENESLKKGQAGAGSLQKQIDRLSYQLEEAKKGHHAYREQHKHDLEKKEHEIEKLKEKQSQLEAALTPATTVPPTNNPAG